ncbi:MAG: DNA-binding protein [Bacteroidetes bacterium CG23_combo_of_CG06-09_8_20_14_all_32_9]|nr:MAG: DNA-binding protein [Bacteroidetes bacterium CG23_combo_of_CG06-09_8_20_14_all_32_9]
MKDYVIDANIIFSSLLSGKGIYRKFFENYVLYTPDFALNELQLYQNEILTKTKLSKEQLQEFTLFVFSKLIVVPELYITKQSRIKAYDLCKDIDIKDTIYVALTIEFNNILITRDKPLHDGLISKGFENVLMFNILIDQIDKDSSLFQLE